MHMADALVNPAVATSMYLCSAVACGYSMKKIRLEDNPKKLPMMGVMGAFVFATQMINFTIPGTGSSGHLCGGMLLTALLGPSAGFVTMIGILLTQALLFADGGLLALGCNIWNMSFYGCFIGGCLIWKPLMKHGASKVKITLASILGCVLTLQLGAFSVTLETLASRITEIPFSVFVVTMQPIHLAIGLVEGLISASVLIFIYETRPELLWGTGTNEVPKKNRLTLKSVLLILSGLTIVIGGLLSLFASAFPDGLEWSLEKVAGTAELSSSGILHSTFEKIQNFTSILPDYAFSNSETAAGTSFSGIFGAMVVIALCLIVGRLFRFFQRKKVKDE